MTAAEGMSNDDLARLCSAETEKFARQQPSDTSFCFELLRRALAGASEAFTLVYRIYERQVYSWVQRLPQFALVEESADYFVSAAWVSLLVAQRRPGFAGFRSLPQALAYLKRCVFSAVAQYLRDQQRPAAPLEAAARVALLPDLQADVEVDILVRRMMVLLPDPRDRLLVHAAFVEGLPPREVIEAYPGRWRDERAVTVDLYRIRRLLRNDAELRRLFGMDT